MCSTCLSRETRTLDGAAVRTPGDKQINKPTLRSKDKPILHAVRLSTSRKIHAQAGTRNNEHTTCKICKQFSKQHATCDAAQHAYTSSAHAYRNPTWRPNYCTLRTALLTSRDLRALAPCPVCRAWFSHVSKSRKLGSSNLDLLVDHLACKPVVLLQRRRARKTTKHHRAGKPPCGKSSCNMAL